MERLWPGGRAGVDYWERLSRIGTLMALAAALAAAIAAPLWAVSWVNRPFLGVLVEHSLVVNRLSGANWSGHTAGIDGPQRILRVGGRAVETSGAFQALMADLAVGAEVPVFTVQPDGTAQLYPAVRVMAFPRADLWSLFVPGYLIGCAYLIIGLWVFRLRGNTRPGRVLAFFCFCAATTCVLIFDLWTTHGGTILWTIAVAMCGGAILSLAMRFPAEWGLVRRQPGLLAVPYVLSLALAAWGVAALWDRRQPWAYVTAWNASYRYVGLAIAALLAVSLYRARTADARVTRQQARVVLVGSALAFLPITIWFLAPAVGRPLVFEPIVFLPSLILFPAALWIAIRRYRLLEVDDLVNRTLLYGLLTAILAGVYTISITISQKVFVAVTGEKSDAAIVLTTLIVVSAITPLRARLQALLDRHLKSGVDRGAELRRFTEQVRLLAQVGRPELLAQRLLEESVRSLQAESGALTWRRDGVLATVYATPLWAGDAWVAAPVVVDARHVATLSLGRPVRRRRYTQAECDALAGAAREIATWLDATGARAG